MGLAVLDTSVVIAALNRDDALHPAASQAVRAERDRHALAISALTYAELLVGPLRGRRAGAGGGRALLRPGPDRRPVTVRRPTRRRAPGGRGLKLPDAVIVATGLRLQADAILTADARWKGIETVTVVQAQR